MCKNTENSWKDKAVSRSGEIKVLKKEKDRQKRRASRWKKEAIELRRENEDLKAKAKNNKLIINELDFNESNKERSVKGDKIGEKKYSTSFRCLCVNLYLRGLSLRQVCAIIGIISIFVGKRMRIPCHGTISIWVHKVGLGLLKKGQERFIQSKEHWALIIDESYSLGKSRLLVVLAVRLSKLETGRIRTQDVIPIVIKSQEHWKSKDINACITAVCRGFKGKIGYVTSDYGNNIVGMCKERGIAHVPDWAHHSANLLEKIYAKEEKFKEFNDKMSAFKRKRKQSIYTHYVPPSFSVKVRFMNYIPFLEWANIMLDNFNRIPQEIKGELVFLKDLKPFITEVTALFYTVQEIGFLIKENGVCPVTYGQAHQKLNNLAKDYPNNDRINLFIQQIEVYFKQILAVYHQYMDSLKHTKQVNVTSFFEGVVASSEILECLFGKLKHRSDKNPKRGFSGNSLLIALFSTEITEKNTEDAFQNIDCNTLDEWKNKNIVNRKYASFRNVFKNKGKKNRRS